MTAPQRPAHRRIVRPAELPAQRGPHSSARHSGASGRPVGSGVPRPARRVPDRLAGVAESLIGLVITVTVLMATIAMIGLVFGAWLVGA